jgi:hypothetical protein
MTKAQLMDLVRGQEDTINQLEARNQELRDEIRQVELALDNRCEEVGKLKRVIVQKCLDELK